MYFGSKRKSAARRLKLRDRIISMLLAVSLLCGNPIVLPTGAAEVAYCGIEEHSHSEECYTTDSVLTCGVTQENHVHSEACKQTEKTLTCTIVEQVHEHTDACYTTTTNLTCTEHVHTADCAQELTCTDTTEGHAHTDACYAYTCADPDSTHQHTDSCYTTESVLICDYHQHTDECYTTTEVNTCGVTQDNHTHSDACYGGEKTLSCTREEHTHTLACESNPEADLETADDWEDKLPKEDDFTGVWTKDLLAVVQSQVGYQESVSNYIVEEDGSMSGYNRYGAWYSSYTPDKNQPYAPWNVTFLFFSIYYSGISDFPLEETCADWVKFLNDYDLYREVGKTYPVSEEDTEGEAYTPTPGDMVFVDTDEDGEADRVGVFSESKENLLTGKQLIVIEGDVDGAVAEVAYAEDTDVAAASEDTDPEPRIVGYADMTQAQADAQPETSDVSMLETTLSAGDYLYLDATTNVWHKDGAQFALYFSNDTWSGFFENVEGSIWRIQLPSTWNSAIGMIFVRLNNTCTSPSWSDSWGQIPGKDQGFKYVQANSNKFNITSYTEGTWDGNWYTTEKRTIYYDATLSKLSYNGDWGTATIPVANGNAEGSDIWCHYWKDGENGTTKKMTKLASTTVGGNTYSDVYYADISTSADRVIFYSSSDGEWPAENSSSRTGNIVIPSDTSLNCFYGDTSDDAIYTPSVRSGYWGEAFTVRDPGTVGTVVDIPQETRENDADKLYLNTTFYDYYTDFELNGNNRDNYSTDASKTTHRIYQPFRQFNQALSSYYSGISASNPLYWGNFQNYNTDANSDHFDEIAGTLNLYGYSADNKAKFFAENNSMWGYDGKELTNNDKDGAQATMGLVSNELTNGNLMIKTSGGSAIAPFFSKSFLEGGNSKNTVLGKVYENVSFPFTKEALGSSSDPDATGTVDYWVFDSRVTTLRLKEDSTAGYWLDSTDDPVYGSTATQASTSDKNFFPFNSGSQSAKSQQLNYGFATKLELKFRLTDDGTVKTTDNKDVPIEFNFSGDDDVWVFIDGKLALDVGGGHGRVAGYLNFRDKEYHVDRVKGSNGGVVYGKNDTFTMNGANTDEHTLTMFYMERGLWESNMMITFNFPDENQLEVKKEVDTTDVNSLFDGVFENKSLFTFSIKNLATHYGAVAAEGASTATAVALDTTSANSKVSLTAYPGNIFDRWKLDAFNSDDSVVHWYAKEYDTASDYREKRYGTMSLNTGDGSPNIVDLSKMSYMEFEVYVLNATPSLSKMYIQLKDTYDNVLTKDDSNKLHLSSSVYGSVSPQKNQWFKVRLSLSDMLASSVAKGTILGYIRFGYDEPVNIFLRGFKFLPAVSASENNVGFVKQQYAIADYGSSTSGILEPAVGAVYTSDKSLARAVNAVDANGEFVLAAGETVSFYNQFRRGSYIALKENVPSELFDTTWTMYENSKPVTSMGTGDTVRNGSVTSLNGVSGTAVEDGRTEVRTTGQPDGITIENEYNGTKPSESAFVFRSYVAPDNTTSATKLKVVFTNKVKTGSLTITKEKAGTADLTGTFTFYVVFTNVGGMSLESAPIVAGPITLSVGGSKTISGIPINTEYAVYEIKSDNANITLDHITDDVYTDKYPYEVTTYKVDGTDKGAYMASGVIDGETNNVTYYNIQKEVVSLKLTKLWDGLAENEEPPMSIKVQLQCSTDGDEWVSYNDYYEAKDIGPGYESWDGYTFEFTNLDKYHVANDGTQTLYQYRVVELDSEGNVITSTNDVKGVLDVNGTKYEVTYETGDNVVDDKGNTIGFTQTITNKLKPKAKVTVTKAWNVPTGVTKPGSVTVQLQRRTDNNYFSAIDGLDNVTLNEDNNWTYTFDDLEEKDSNNALYEYRVVELDSEGNVIRANGTVNISDVDYRVTYSGTDGNADHKPDTTNEYTQTITNTVIPTVTLQITKLDATDQTKKLEGVVFKLEKKDDDAFTALDATTGTDGIATFEGLKAGTYKLTETKAKSGYSLLKSSIEIVITEKPNAITGAITYTAKVNDSDADSFEPGEGTNVYTLAMTVYNKQGLTMPSTGGTHGFEYWILGGLCITAIPLLLYTLLGFKKGGKYSRK